MTDRHSILTNMIENDEASANMGKPAHEHSCTISGDDANHTFCRCACGAIAYNSMGVSEWTKEPAVAPSVSPPAPATPCTKCGGTGRFDGWKPVIAVYPDGTIELNAQGEVLDDAFAKLAASFARACARPEDSPRIALSDNNLRAAAYMREAIG